MIPAPEGRSAPIGSAARPQIEADHVSLRSFIDRLDEMLDTLLAGNATQEDAMIELLADFRRLLMQHLRREEESRVLEQAAEEEPRFANRIEGLLREHEALCEAAQALCAEAAGRRWNDFQARFDDFCSLLRAHEESENEVLMGAYLDEIGGRG